MISFDHVTYAYEGKETPSLRDCTCLLYTSDAADD